MREVSVVESSQKNMYVYCVDVGIVRCWARKFRNSESGIPRGPQTYDSSDNGNILDFRLGGAQFESQPGDRSYLIVFLSVSKKILA